MNLINDLSTEVAFAVLVEKKHLEKINSSDVLPLISRIKEVLRSIPTDEVIRENRIERERNAKAALY